MNARLILATFCLFFLSFQARAADLDLSRTAVLTPPGLTGPAAKAVQMLLDEVETRSLIRWPRIERWPTDARAVLIAGLADEVRKLLTARDISISLPAASERKPEGYQIGIVPSEKTPVIWIAGNDPRGVLFGIGRLLRELRLHRLKITLPANFAETSAPTTPLRGHQIGYRPKTNSYDAWTVSMWEQYIRDLAVFGCNAVELIPPRSDDDDDSPLFPLPPLRMMIEVSRLADAYGLDVWVWYPAMDKDYADPKTVEFALKEWGAVFQALPRLDAVFVPGGDPGHTRPRVLFDLLQKQAANLRKYHPRASLWMSPQSFTADWMKEFDELIRRQPSWLTGVVYGPQTRISLSKLRASLPRTLPLRDYPDITHSRQCQYPVPDWDVAFAVTQGREVSNPRPKQTAQLFHYGRASTFGFITYSEGCHDDVNKMIWSALGWNARADLRQILQQYGRYFVSPEFADRFAEGLFALERNWVGPVLENTGIDQTLKLFQSMERDAGPREKWSWRFQQALYRAYYDGYLRARLKHETAAQQAALAKLQATQSSATSQAITEATAILDRAAKVSVAPDLRSRLGELAEALFQSIRAQLSVTKYHGMPGRGNSLDTVDAPLTDIAWLRAEMTAILKLTDEAARFKRLQAMLHRTDPGPGGFYDDFGNPQRQPHLDRGLGWQRDPGFDESPQCAFAIPGSSSPPLPRSWWYYAETHYETPLRAHYNGLDPTASYRLRVVYGPQAGRKVRLRAGDRHLLHDYLLRPYQPLEFDIPSEAIRAGKLTLTWTQEPGAGGPGRGCQVCEVWILKKPVAPKPDTSRRDSASEPSPRRTSKPPAPLSFKAGVHENLPYPFPCRTFRRSVCIPSVPPRFESPGYPAVA